MKTAWFDCFSGVSGDMTLGALLAAGGDENHLRAELAKLNVQGFELVVSETSINGIGATDVDVKLTEIQGHGRHLHHIAEILESSDISPNVRKIAYEVFQIIAEAEAKIHQSTVESIHFHEVGAVDAIVDIVGSCVLLTQLGVEQVICSPLPMGHGFVNCAHGTIPLPAPAVLEILKDVPCYNVDVEGELVTPTGAALMKTLASDFARPSAFVPTATGYGSGKKRFGNRPNLLRVMIGECPQVTKSSSDTVILIEANIDDMNPQFFDSAMESLFQKGALDVFSEPIVMKKGRLATKLSVLCKPEDINAMAETLFRETTTIGVRYEEMNRMILDRHFETVATPIGNVVMKIGSLNGKVLNVQPEFDDLKRIKANTDLSLMEISDMARRAYFSEQK